jgi:hypothetical protein
MDTVTILRDLWRVRLFVAGVALLAVLIGTAVVYKISFPPKLESRRHTVGVATARILVDTPSSQVVAVAPKGSDTLGVRANLLASLMVDGVIRTTIAQRAGLHPNQLAGVTDAATDQSPAPAQSGRQANVLTTQVLTNSAGDQLPIIEVDAQAPDGARAARLANAAVSGLRDYLNSKAALQKVPDADRLQVIGLGAPQASTQVKGPSNVLAFIATIFMFVLGCAAILAVTALRRGWQAAAAREGVELEEAEPVFWDDGGDEVAEEPYVVEVATATAQEDDDWLAETPRPALLPPRLAPVDTDEPPAKRAWGG